MLLVKIWRRDGLMVSALASGSSVAGSNVFLVKTLFSHSAFLYSAVYVLMTPTYFAVGV